MANPVNFMKNLLMQKHSRTIASSKQKLDQHPRQILGVGLNMFSSYHSLSGTLTYVTNLLICWDTTLNLLLFPSLEMTIKMNE